MPGVPAPGASGDTLTRHRKGLPALTGVRFFAAFYVVLFHSSSWLESRFHVPVPLKIFFGNGYLAVAFFFVLSGFILAYTYDGQIAGPSHRLRFWQARFARIYPVYFLSLALAYYFERALSLPAKFAVLAMVQAWNPLKAEFAGAWNYPAWSLSVEAFFYLLFPFVLPWLSGRSKSALAVLLGALLAASALLQTPIQGLGLWHPSPRLPLLALPIIRLPEFLAGVILGLWLLRRRPPLPSPARWIRVTLAAAATLFLLSVPIGGWVSLVILPFALLIYELAASANWLGRFFSTKSMVLLGGASYSVYLLQYPARSWVRVIFSVGPSALVSLGAPLMPVILVLVSIAVFLFWEEPMRHAIRRWFARPRTVPQESV
jgi:peptidoglycan/LPS O-acetylase OafA/YrhL